MATGSPSAGFGGGQRERMEGGIARPGGDLQQREIARPLHAQKATSALK